jgi:small subunit ribosomal protein S1
MGKKKGKLYNQEQADQKKELTDESFEQLMAESFQPVKSVQVGDEVEATVISYDNDYFYLDLGTRLDGLVKKEEYTISGEPTIDEGDVIKVYVTGQHGGVWLCSGRIGSGNTNGKDTRKTAALMALEDAYNQNKPVEGQVNAATKGGFEVEIMGVKTFCPISQIDRAYCDNPASHVDQIYPFEIIGFEENGDNIIVSRREYLNHQAEKESERLWAELDENKTYHGTITAVRDFGAFIDIGGIEGLLHISEISHERLEKAGDVLEAGQKIEISIKNINRQMRKVSFSRKSLLEDPWTAAMKKLVVGNEYEGKVVRLKTFGAFIQLFPGVDGLVHISKLGTGRRHQHPKEVLKVGEIINVRIVEINEPEKKISLSMEKEEGDFTKDLARIQKEQNKTVSSAEGPMAGLVDEALKDS